MVGAVLLPNFKALQTEDFKGPVWPYGQSNSTLSLYYLPPIDKGDPIIIVLSNFTLGGVSMSVFPTSAGSLIATGPALVEVTPAGFQYAARITSTGTQPYVIFVVSYNRTQFDLLVQARWSPYTVWSIYIAPAALAAFGSATAAYYYDSRARREKEEADALAGTDRQTESER